MICTFLLGVISGSCTYLAVHFWRRSRAATSGLPLHEPGECEHLWDEEKEGSVCWICYPDRMGR